MASRGGMESGVEPAECPGSGRRNLRMTGRVALIDSGAMHRLLPLIVLMLAGASVIGLYAAFQSAIAQPIALITGIAMGVLVIVILFRAAMVPQSRYTGWVHGITGRNGRWVFFGLIILWGLFMAGIKVLPKQNEGGLGLIGLLGGFFIFMGFIWSVISE